MQRGSESLMEITEQHRTKNISPTLELKFSTCKGVLILLCNVTAMFAHFNTCPS